MPKFVAAGLGMFCVLLAIFSAVQTNRIDDLEGKLADLSKNVKQIERKKAVALAAEVPSPSAMAPTNQGGAGVLASSVGEAVEPFTVQSAPLQLGGDPAPPALMQEEDITKLVDARVEAKLKESGRQRGGGGERKMKATELAQELELDAATQGKVSAIADNTKTEIYQMLSTPRSGGGSFLDDLRVAMQTPNREGVGKVFYKLFSDKIPGTDVTYIGGINEIRGRSHESLKVVMGGDTYQDYSGMKIHPDHILTDYDPFAEFEALDDKNDK